MHAEWTGRGPAAGYQSVTGSRIVDLGTIHGVRVVSAIPSRLGKSVSPLIIGIVITVVVILRRSTIIPLFWIVRRRGTVANWSFTADTGQAQIFFEDLQGIRGSAVAVQGDITADILTGAAIRGADSQIGLEGAEGILRSDLATSTHITGATTLEAPVTGGQAHKGIFQILQLQGITGALLTLVNSELEIDQITGAT